MSIQFDTNIIHKMSAAGKPDIYGKYNIHRELFLRDFRHA